MINVYLVDPLTIVRHGGFDKYNDPLPATDQDAMGYVEWGTRLVRNLAGEEEMAIARILLPYDQTVNHEDKIRIGAVEYSILNISPAKDFSNEGMWIAIS